jgi:hypothetical protein
MTEKNQTMRNTMHSASALNIKANTGAGSLKKRISRLTKKAEPPPTRGVNRDSGTASANGGWLRRLVRHQRREIHNKIRQIKTLTNPKAPHLPGAQPSAS